MEFAIPVLNIPIMPEAFLTFASKSSVGPSHMANVVLRSFECALYHPGLAEIHAPVGSQDVMSQLRDYPNQQ